MTGQYYLDTGVFRFFLSVGIEDNVRKFIITNTFLSTNWAKPFSAGQK